MQLIAVLRIIKFRYKLMTVPLPRLWWGYELRYSRGGNGRINKMLEIGLYYTTKNSAPKLGDNRNQRNLNTRRGN